MPNFYTPRYLSVSKMIFPQDEPSVEEFNPVDDMDKVHWSARLPDTLSVSGLWCAPDRSRI